jgi:sec-independent protein translocase protein TatB
MFDVGISEIMVIAVVALIVLGPEKLPKTARTLGHLFGRLQRYVGEVKADINRELALEDLKKLQAEVHSAASDFQASVNASAKEVQDNIRSVETSLNASVAGETAPVRERGAAPDPEPEPPTVAAALPSASSAPMQPSQPSQPPAGPSAEPSARDTPQQASLPGFDRG